MNDLLGFYANIDKIKHIERSGWACLPVEGIKDTIASHSFGASLISWIISKREGLDEARLIKLLLVHDLIMAHIDDITPPDPRYAIKRQMENDASEMLLVTVPPEIKEEFAALFREYQDQQTEEALLARECDKLDTLFQALSYARVTRDSSKFRELLSVYAPVFRSGSGKAIHKELQAIAVL